MPDQAAARSGDDAHLDVEDRFAVVPEWLLDAPISDCAVRLYAVLLRYGQVSGARMPSRATLARRLHKKSTDTVDRAMRELGDLGAVAVSARWAGRERLTNAYRVRTSNPVARDAPREAPSRRRAEGGGPQGGRLNAATPVRAAEANPAADRVAPQRGSRTNRVTVAASMRHNPEFSTERETPPPSAESSAHFDSIAKTCGIPDWPQFGDACRRARSNAGQALGRWSNPCLNAALQLAVTTRGWPAEQAAAALLAVAADPVTRSPMRVAEAGPWWDGRADDSAGAVIPSAHDVEEAETALVEAGGLRVLLQREARDQLRAEGHPIRRATVVVRAAELLRSRAAEVVAS